MSTESCSTSSEIYSRSSHPGVNCIIFQTCTLAETLHLRYLSVRRIWPNTAESTAFTREQPTFVSGNSQSCGKWSATRATAYHNVVIRICGGISRSLRQFAMQMSMTIAKTRCSTV